MRNASPAQIGNLNELINQAPAYAVPVGLAAVIIVIFLVLVFGVLVPSCSHTEEPAQQATEPALSESAESANSASAESSAATGSASADDSSFASAVSDTSAPTTPTLVASVGDATAQAHAKVDALVTLLGEDDADKLFAQAKTDADAQWIVTHVDQYEFEGIEVQYKILKLAANDAAAIPYVRHFPEKYPMDGEDADKAIAMDSASPSDSVPSTSVPHLYQWDRRWAYTIYSSTSFGLTGCGPTSFAMVYQGVTGNTDRTPHDMAVLAEERGYMSEYDGTDSAFFTDVAPELGMTCEQADPDSDVLTDALSSGKVVLVNLGPGYFTSNGHFFVATGLANDGKVIINDPYSVVNSSQTWDASFIASEAMGMWVYSA